MFELDVTREVSRVIDFKITEPQTVGALFDERQDIEMHPNNPVRYYFHRLAIGGNIHIANVKD